MWIKATSSRKEAYISTLGKSYEEFASKALHLLDEYERLLSGIPADDTSLRNAVQRIRDDLHTLSKEAQILGLNVEAMLTRGLVKPLDDVFNVDVGFRRR